MGKVVQIYNLNSDGFSNMYGEPFGVCNKHLEWVKHKFVIRELGTIPDKDCFYDSGDCGITHTKAAPKPLTSSVGTDGADKEK